MLVALDDVWERKFSAEGLRWPGLYIISGYRTATEQSEVNPSNPNSLHRRCPSLAADLRVGDQPASITDPSIWSAIGRDWNLIGGTWGGDFLPPDWNHFSFPGIGMDPAERQPI